VLRFLSAFNQPSEIYISASVLLLARESLRESFGDIVQDHWILSEKMLAILCAAFGVAAAEVSLFCTGPMFH
jgi:hypothetical protein